MIAASLEQRGLAALYLCPQLPPSPRDAIALASELAAAVDPNALMLIGSSLGGYYVTWMAERIGCKAVLLNPAVNPLRDLQNHVGVTTAYHSDQCFEFKHEYIDELAAFSVNAISKPERYFLLAATGDEVLDWREMVEHYPGARHCIIDGSDHGLSDFACHIDDVLAFCGVLAESAQ